MYSFWCRSGAGQAGKRKPCFLGAEASAGHSHILVECPVLSAERSKFLAGVDQVFARRPSAAPRGDWASALLTPHLDVDKLNIVVSFCAGVLDAFK